MSRPAGRARVRVGPGVRFSLTLMGDVEGLRRGEMQVIDVPTLPQGPEAAALLAGGVREYMVVPMMAGGELIGGLSFGGTPGQFPREHVSIAQEVANQLATAIAQTRLDERVKQNAVELEQQVGERTRELRTANDRLEEEIAERRRAETEADRANQAKSEFLSRMSHELRTPLNAVLGFAQLLEIDSLTVAQRDSVDHILRGGRHLLGLIDEILDISRIEAGHLALSMEPVLLDEVIRETFELIRPLATTWKVHVDVGPSEPGGRYVLADRQRLKQVLLNFLSNAAKFNRSGGAVTIGVEESLGDRFRINVADTGPGIPSRLMERLFTPRPNVKLFSAMHASLGLELAREHRPSLILLDLQLPDIPGPEVLKRLQRDPATRHIPVVV